MRILMLNNEYPPLGGGTATVNEALLREMSGSAALEIDLITSSADCCTVEEAAPNIRIFRLPVGRACLHHASNTELARYAVKSFAMARRLARREQYDLCLAWSAVPAGGAAYALKVLTGLPYIVRVSGPDIPGFERRYAAITRVLRPVIRLILRNAVRVVAKCRGEAELVQTLDPRLNVCLINNGVDADNFRVSRPSPQTETLRLLCVARLIERKGHRQLFEALCRLREQGIACRLELVGDGDSKASLVKLADELGLADVVAFAGYVPRDEIKKHYEAADVFVLASENEGMSIAALEALASGLPLVVSDCPGMRELVTDGENGFVFRQGGVDELVRHLGHLHRARELLRQMGTESERRAGMFSWKAVAESYCRLFTEVSAPAGGVSAGDRHWFNWADGVYTASGRGGSVRTGRMQQLKWRPSHEMHLQGSDSVDRCRGSRRRGA